MNYSFWFVYAWFLIKLSFMEINNQIIERSKLFLTANTCIWLSYCILWSSIFFTSWLTFSPILSCHWQLYKLLKDPSLWLGWGYICQWTTQCTILTFYFNIGISQISSHRYRPICSLWQKSSAGWLSSVVDPRLGDSLLWGSVLEKTVDGRPTNLQMEEPQSFPTTRLHCCDHITTNESRIGTFF